MHDDRTLALLDHVGHDTQHRRDRRIDAVDVGPVNRAFGPVDVWSVDDFLDILAGEVDGRLRTVKTGYKARVEQRRIGNHSRLTAYLYVSERPREPKDIP